MAWGHARDQALSMTGESGQHSRAADELTREFRAAASDQPETRVEEYLAQTRTWDADTDVRELVAAEMEIRLEAGEALSEEEFARRFPYLADDVSSMLAAATASVNRQPARPAPPITQQEGEFGDYELLEVIGRGGMGIVYRARQRKLNRIVAVKTILSGKLARQEQVDRFHREAEAAARLDHPGIVPVFEIGEVNDVVFFSMGFVPGASLADELDDRTLAPRRAAELVRQLAEAVHYAHESGVLHRDLKPANILLDASGDPRITDFGLAKLIDQDGMTMTGAVVGTPSYMSPEQASGATESVGPVSDVYGLGAILYACLCGHAPFRGPSAVATLRMVTTERPAPLRQFRQDIPRDLETICEKCLEKPRSARYQTAKELADELQRYLDGRPILARPLPAWVRLGHWCRRNPLVAGLVSTVALTLIVGFAVSAYFAVLADRRATSAEEGFKAARGQSELALRTLQTVIYTVQDRLAKIPAAREARRELLIQALADLEKVSSGYIEQASVDRESAKVLTDLAELYTQVGDEAGTGVIELMDTNYRRAVEMYIQLLADNPTDVELTKAAVEAALDYGDTAREYRRFKDAIWAHRRGREFASAWHERDPQDAGARLATIKSTEALGEALLRSGDREECKAYILEAEQLAIEYADEHRTPLAYDNLARCYCTAGDMHRDLGDLDAAEGAYDRMCGVTLTLMKLEPDNPKLLGDRSTDFERLGDLQMSRKDWDKAREHFEQTVSFAEQYLATDPDNLYMLQETTWGYKKLAQACDKQGDTDRAKWARDKLAEVNARLKQGK